MLRSKVFALCLILPLLGGEPSAFESQSGATKKDIKNLKDASLNLSSLVVDLQGRLEALEQMQYGIQSLYDAQGQKVQKLSEELEAQNIFMQETRARLEVLKDQFEQLRLTQAQNEENYRSAMKSLDGLGEKIKEVSQVGSALNDLVLKEFESVRAEFAKQADVIAKDQENIQKLSLEIEKIYEEKKKIAERNAFKNPQKKLDVFKEAKSMYWGKNFDDARIRFAWLLEQGYEKAESSFFLGQIAFRQRRYNDAIVYFKQSAVLNDKASYMPVLLLHTIKSFQALNDNKSALTFAQSLIAYYPKSKEAAQARAIEKKIKGEKSDAKS
ncbi:hypothetical protein [uncultured Helicobacter sp.]|uniref:hypothetical protein n=1 Tax=uncultured Helicobacter sp. TaxID=175537 RepID=UPI002610D318|nr:hypothetical protein [uncultured Helicobacter sp.]